MFVRGGGGGVPTGYSMILMKFSLCSGRYIEPQLITRYHTLGILERSPEKPCSGCPNMKRCLQPHRAIKTSKPSSDELAARDKKAFAPGPTASQSEFELNL